MQNYILIRVTEPPPTRGGSTKAGLLRRELHELADEWGIEVADNIIREDREVFPNGRPVPYAEAQALFRKVM